MININIIIPLLFAFLTRKAATDCKTSIALSQINLPGIIYKTNTSLNVSIFNMAKGSFLVD